MHWIIHVGLSQSQGGKKVGKDCESGVCWLVWVMEGGDMGLIFVQFSHFCAIKYPSPPEHFPLGNGSLVVLCKVPLTCSTSQSFLLGNPMEQRNYVISSNPFCKPGSTCSTFDRIQPHQQKKMLFPEINNHSGYKTFKFRDIDNCTIFIFRFWPLHHFETKYLNICYAIHVWYMFVVLLQNCHHHQDLIEFNRDYWTFWDFGTPNDCVNYLRILEIFN